MTAAVEQIVTEFQRLEIFLLQSGEFEKWLGLVSPEIRYVMPIAENVDPRMRSAPTAGMVWCNDDFGSLSIKVRRIQSGSAIGHTTPVRLRYVVQNFSLERTSEQTIAVQSNVLIHKSQSDGGSFFVAGREDELVLRDDRWLLGSRVIHLDHTVRGVHTHQDVFF